MINKHHLAIAAVALLPVLASTPANADNKYAVGAQVGTDGYGIEGQYSLTERLAIRGGYHDLSFGIDDEDYDGITYNGDLEFKNMAAFLDYHPFNNGLFFSGGAYFGDKSVALSAVPTGTVVVGSTSVTSVETGTLNSRVSLADTAPYLGFGFDNGVFGGDSPLAFHASVGVMFTDTPDVSLTSVGGTLSTDPTFLAELAQEAQNLQDDISDFEYYPVVKVGLTLRF